MSSRAKTYIGAMISASVLATGPGAAAESRVDDALPSRGHCRETVLAVPTESARVREHLPARFEPDDHGTGVTYVAAFGERCRLAAGPDEPTQDSYLFGTITPVLTAEERSETFDFSWTTTDIAYHSRLRTMGFGELVPRATYDERELAGGVIDASAAVPGGAMPFRFSATTGPTPVTPAMPVDSVHWSAAAGQHFVRCVYLHDFTRVTGAQGTVTAAPGSDLEEMIGKGPRQAAGLFAEFDFTGDCRFG